MYRAVMIILLALTAAACQAAKPDPQAIAISRAVFDEFRRGQNEALAPRLDPALRAPKAVAQIDRLQALVPSGEPRGSKLVGASQVTVAGHGAEQAVVMEYDFGDRAALFQTRLSKAPGAAAWVVKGFDIRVATAKELAANDFTLAGKSAGQYGFLALAILSPLLMLAALAKVVLTPGLKRKWLWAPLAFVGIFGLTMNWTTGHLLVQWISLQVLGFGITSGLSRFDPWIITATLPIGALLVLADLWAIPSRGRKPSPASGDSGPSPAP